MRCPLRLPVIAIGLIVGFVAAACTSVPSEKLSVPLPTTTVESEPASVAEVESESTAESNSPAVAGELAIGGLEGMVVADASGAVVRSAFPSGVATQPTWSRAGDRAISFVPSATGGSVVVSVGDESFVVGARRPYFFFSWSGDGAYVAALGPGPRGTSLDILTSEGELATDETIDTGSFYLAWEPGGDDLVVHLDDELFLLRDPRDLETRESLGTPGQSFLAPVWIPDTRDIVIVDDSDGGRLTRLDVDDRSERDLGPGRGVVGMTVSPDATRLFVTHGGPDSERGNEIEISIGSAGRPVQETRAASEVIALESGDRTPVSDEPSIWAEWAPDGSALALLQPVSQGARWLIADGRGLRELGTMQATPTFLRNYLFFSWQYVESPRIWAPNADAIVYAAVEAGIPGIYVHPLNGERVRVSDGDVAFFAPRPDGGTFSPT
ncbi:MAG TPA: hypothetical protein DCE75_10615 [Acidimicrobiaceae bacterium]|nr:hypothetical protein [Acidimicrobiaceae bacterium]